MPIVQIRYLGDIRQIEGDLALYQLVQRFSFDIAVDSSSTLEEMISSLQEHNDVSDVRAVTHEFSFNVESSMLATLLGIEAECIPLLLSEVVIEERDGEGALSFVTDVDLDIIGDDAGSLDNNNLD